MYITIYKQSLPCRSLAESDKPGLSSLTTTANKELAKSESDPDKRTSQDHHISTKQDFKYIQLTLIKAEQYIGEQMQKNLD